MDMIDQHLHIESLNQESLELMTLAGIKAVIANVSVPDVDVAGEVSTEEVLSYYDRILRYHSGRLRTFLIDTYVCLGVCFLSVPKDYEKILAKLPTYFNDKSVVGVGELGLDPTSKNCPDLTKQEEVMRAQLNLAKEYGKPAVIHIPNIEKLKWVPRYLNIVKELKIDPSKVVMIHNDASVVKMVTDAGCNASITVQPWRKMTPVDAARIIQTADLDRILLDSDCSLPVISDPLSVPKTVFEMRKLGMKEDDIRKVVWENLRRVYSLD